MLPSAAEDLAVPSVTGGGPALRKEGSLNLLAPGETPADQEEPHSLELKLDSPQWPPASIMGRSPALCNWGSSFAFRETGGSLALCTLGGNVAL